MALLVPPHSPLARCCQGGQGQRRRFSST